MKLFYSPTAPFVRKVLVFAHEAGLIQDISIDRGVVSPVRANSHLAAYNPLMTAPTLLTAEGYPLFGSQLICEYLDTLHSKRRLIPQGSDQRWRVGSLHAIADGILEAGLLCREVAHQFHDDCNPWFEGQRLKIRQGLNTLEARSAELSGEVDVGVISVGVAIAWLRFRNVVNVTDDDRPRLA